MIKMTADGQLESTFGIGGVKNVMFDIDGNRLIGITDFMQDDSQRWLCAGFINTPSGLFPAICRFLPDGSLDSTFNETGYSLLTHYHKTVNVQPDGAILLGGDKLSRFIFETLQTEQFDKPQYFVYPNPFDREVYLRLTQPDEISVGLFDVSGRKINQLINRQMVGSEIRLDLPDLRDGMYLLQVYSGTTTNTIKLVK